MTLTGQPSFKDNFSDTLPNQHIAGLYRVAEWNINGFFSKRNNDYMEFKLNVMYNVYHDFFILPETHCLPDETIEIENYTLYQNNRDPKNKKGIGSGGIAIAVHESVLASHEIISIIKGIDGQIAIKLKCKINDIKVGIFGLYLSPDSFKYGKDAEGFFAQASSACLL